MSLSIKGWEQMPYFLATVRQGSLRAAAETLGTTHAKVSRHLNALETSYGMQLMRRTRGGVQLTEAGKLLSPVAEEAEDLFLNAQQRLTGLDRLETGTLRFSVTGTMAYEVVSPILTKFAQAFPGIDIDVQVSDLIQDINRLETDVSLRIADEVIDDVVAHKLYSLAMAYYASPDYLRKNLKHAGPKGQGLQLIGMGALDRHPAWLAQSPFPLAEVRYATTDRYMQLHLARQGFGIIRTMPLLAKNGLELVPVAGNEPQLDCAIWILLHSDLRRTTRVRRFVDFLADELIALKPNIQGTT